MGAMNTQILAQEGGAKIRIGVIGCGGRGSWLAGLFAANENFKVSALADYFQDRVDETARDHDVAADRRFTGLDCHRKMIEAGGLDAVAIVSPPYFHPDQAAAAVDAGLHVWVAKPVAVDVPGCQSIEASGKKASARGTVFLVDFQTRANPLFIEALERVRAGAIGDICFGESDYHAGRLAVKEGSPEGSPEHRLRNWVFDQQLSGDIITEQNIHTLDVMNWSMGTPPASAVGTGGRRVRVDVGDCWDHFALLFKYGKNTGVTFSSRQFGAHGTKGGIINRVFGTKGVLETEYGGRVLIRGDKEVFYSGGKTQEIYKSGVETNIANFAKAIRDGDAENPTVAPSVESNLVTILGRTAAYSGKETTWKALMKDSSTLTPDLEGLKA